MYVLLMRYTGCATPVGHRYRVDVISSPGHPRWRNLLVEGACLAEAACLRVRDYALERIVSSTFEHTGVCSGQPNNTSESSPSC